MLTRKEAAAQKHAIERDIAKDLKAKDRAKVKAFAEELRAARAKRDEALTRARDRCRADRLTLRARVEALREQALEKLREAVRLQRDAARTTCTLQKAEARNATQPALERAKKELDAERAYQEELARIAAGNRKRRAERPRPSSAERRGESDDEVRANLRSDLVPLFDKVRAQIKGSARASRTEVFLEYAEQHPGEVLAVLEDASDALVRKLEAEQAKQARATHRTSTRPTRRARPRYTPEELADVPF